jgi:hypothetical protein
MDAARRLPLCGPRIAISPTVNASLSRSIHPAWGDGNHRIFSMAPMRVPEYQPNRITRHTDAALLLAADRRHPAWTTRSPHAAARRPAL